MVSRIEGKVTGLDGKSHGAAEDTDVSGSGATEQEAGGAVENLAKHLPIGTWG